MKNMIKGVGIIVYFAIVIFTVLGCKPAPETEGGTLQVYNSHHQYGFNTKIYFDNTEVFSGVLGAGKL
jgi:hypothetical protein